MEKVIRIVKKNEEENDYKFWITKYHQERFDAVEMLLNQYFYFHSNVPQRLQRVYRIIVKNKVAYLVVGGHAVIFHVYPRLTSDLDIWFKNTPEKISK